MIEDELIQIRPNWYKNNEDINRWSRIHPRFIHHIGCVVDLGCLGWNKNFTDKRSGNWSGYFFNKKRVIGVDPQENPNEHAEFFKGFVSNFTGKAGLVSKDIYGSISRSVLKSKYEVLKWKDFKVKFSIDSISILKINIEGGEWDLIDSFDSDDLGSIDQICVSFHNFLSIYNNEIYKQKTKHCIKKIILNNYTMIDLKIYGWKLFLKT